MTRRALLEFWSSPPNMKASRTALHLCVLDLHYTNLFFSLGVSDIVAVSAGTDNSFAISKDGKVYSWGFSSNYQTGQGTLDDIHVPTLIDNSAIRDKKIIAAGAGGQFSVVIGVPEEATTNGDVNGTN